MSLPSVSLPEPYNVFHLPVSPLHTLYVEEVGNPQGVPVLFLHGGPGGGIEPKHRLLFDSTVFRAILFDQRGAGKSTPYASLEENTTWHLVEDSETLRKHLGIERWLVLGGSWGSTLALAYAQRYPQQVLGLVLRGVFLGTDAETDWLFQHGCSWLNPQAWEAFIAPIPKNERNTLVHAYYQRFMRSDKATQLACAQAWATWEGVNCKLERLPEAASTKTAPAASAYTFDPAIALALARLECHYSYHHYFFNESTALLANVHKLHNTPMAIVHGRYDVVCPLNSAWQLHKAVPHSTLNVVPMAGHASSEPGLFEAQQHALLTMAASLDNRWKT